MNQGCLIYNTAECCTFVTQDFLIMVNKFIIGACLLILVLSRLNAQENRHFTLLTFNQATPVKDQAYSGTCWSFGTLSFVESELIRLGQEKTDLSEMFIVRHIYPEKAENYIRWHGKVFLTAGGQSHDVMRVVKEYGLMPETTFSGRAGKNQPHHHQRLDSVITSVCKAILKNGRPSSRYPQVISTLMDLYLGVPPDTFLYKRVSYTPATFRDAMGFNPEDYIEITSYSDHPWYQPYVMDSRYNWSHDLYWNVPLEDFMEIIDHALENGYTLAWDGDVSEEGFSFEQAIALVPLKPWTEQTAEERVRTFTGNEKELKVDDELRMKTFRDGTTTIDHIMHITGIAKDQRGKRYYYTKNSWGEFNGAGGYMYLSESYVRLKTVAVMVHRDAVPAGIQKKLGWTK